MSDRHHVLTSSFFREGVKVYAALCTTKGCGWQEESTSITAAMRAGGNHNPRCEETTTHPHVILTLSCQRMALHPGKHQHTVEWE